MTFNVKKSRSVLFWRGNAKKCNYSVTLSSKFMLFMPEAPWKSLQCPVPFYLLGWLRAIENQNFAPWKVPWTTSNHKNWTVPGFLLYFHRHTQFSEFKIKTTKHTQKEVWFQLLNIPGGSYGSFLSDKLIKDCCPKTSGIGWLTWVKRLSYYPMQREKNLPKISEERDKEVAEHIANASTHHSGQFLCEKEIFLQAFYAVSTLSGPELHQCKKSKNHGLRHRKGGRCSWVG